MPSSNRLTGEAGTWHHASGTRPAIGTAHPCEREVLVIPDDLRYTTDHEWVRVEPDGTATVGITHFAQDALGDIVFVDLPDVDRTVAAGESCAEVESVKSVSEIYAPIAGRIVEVNATVVEAPETVNADPYGAGWLFRTAIDDTTQLDALLDAAGYATATDGS